jgi:hypothetical protein
VWYGIAEKIVIENIGMIGQTTDIVAVKTEAARGGFRSTADLTLYEFRP